MQFFNHFAGLRDYRATFSKKQEKKWYFIGIKTISRNTRFAEIRVLLNTSAWAGAPRQSRNRTLLIRSLILKASVAPMLFCQPLHACSLVRPAVFFPNASTIKVEDAREQSESLRCKYFHFRSVAKGVMSISGLVGQRERNSG